MESFFKKSQFVEHLQSKHQVEVTTECRHFPSEGDFLAWKEQEELRDFVYFTKQAGDIIIVNMMDIINHTESPQNPLEKLHVRLNVAL